MAEPASASTEVIHSSWRGFMQRHERLLPLVLLFLITIPMLTKIFTSDFGTHIALGRHITEKYDIPMREFWNYPSLGMENASGGVWGFQAILYAVFSLGGEYAVSFFVWAVVLGIFFCLYRVSVLRGANRWIAVLSIFAFSGFLRIRIQPRPEIFTYLFIAITIYLLTEYYYGKRKKAIYLFPVLILFWANFHPTYLMAFILWGVLFFDAFCRAAWNRRLRPEEVLKWALAPVVAVAAGVLVCGLNPYGYDRLLEPLHLISRGGVTEQSNVLLSISELTPVKGTGLYLYFKAAAVFAACSLLLGAVGRRIYFLDILLYIIAFKGSYDSARAVSMMGLFLAPGVSIQLSGFIERIGERLSRPAAVPERKELREGKRKKERKGKDRLPLRDLPPPKVSPGMKWRKAAAYGAIVVFLVGFGVTTLSFSFSQLQFGVGITEHKFSFGATEFLRKNPVQGNMFNFFDVGGFLDWQLYPGALTFIDGRTYNQKVFMEHQMVTGAMPGWEEILRRYGVTYIVTKAMDSSGSVLPLIPAIADHPDWRLVFADGLFVVFVRNSPENREYIRKFGIPSSMLHQHIIWEAYHYMYLGVSPIVAYQTMSNMYQLMGNREAAIQSIRKALEYADIPYLRSLLAQLEQGGGGR